MSGGSYNYLCDIHDIADLATRTGDLEAMANRLAGLGYARDAARETVELLARIRQWEVLADVAITRLKGVWEAVEWVDSHDRSEDAIATALAEYRAT